MQTLTKSAFAARIGVSPGRVSQYIAERKLGGAALHGEGSRALIVVDVAMQQLGRSLDMAQRFAQASHSAAPALPLADAVTAPVSAPLPQPSEELPESATGIYNRARAESQLMATEKQRRDMEAEKGRYVLAASVTPAFSRVLSGIILSLDQALPDMAKAVAAALGDADSKTATIALRQAYRAWRAEAAKLAADAEMTMPEFLIDPERQPPAV